MAGRTQLGGARALSLAPRQGHFIVGARGSDAIQVSSRIFSKLGRSASLRTAFCRVSNFPVFGVFSRQKIVTLSRWSILGRRPSLVTFLTRSPYRLGSTGKMLRPYRQDGCVTRKALVPNALFLQFPGGSWQIANSAVSRSFYSWRFAQA
jgi:hypothetical protein